MYQPLSFGNCEHQPWRDERNSHSESDLQSVLGREELQSQARPAHSFRRGWIWFGLGRELAVGSDLPASGVCLGLSFLSLPREIQHPEFILF